MAKEKQFSNLELALGLGGSICPFPVVGEAMLAGFLYGFTKPIFGDSKVAGAVGSLAVASLSRIQLYESFYNPMLNIIGRYCN